MGITAADIRAMRAAPSPFEVEGWGGTVYVRKLPLALRLSIADRFADEDSASFAGDDVLDVVVACVVDEDGNQLFSDDDKAWLNGDFAEEVIEVFAHVSEVAGWSAEALEDAEGN